jgi:hypothetical protein
MYTIQYSDGTTAKNLTAAKKTSITNKASLKKPVIINQDQQ